MNDNYLEGDLDALEKENIELKSSMGWLFTILCIESGVSLLYFIFNKLIIPILCPISAPDYVEKSMILYRILGIVFTFLYLVFYTIGAVKVKSAGFRIGLITMGVLHVIIFVVYQFF